MRNEAAPRMVEQSIENHQEFLKTMREHEWEHGWTKGDHGWDGESCKKCGVLREFVSKEYGGHGLYGSRTTDCPGIPKRDWKER
jgi:hypothetical protein